MTSTTALPAAPIILVTTAHPSLHQHPGPAGEAVHPRLGRLLQPRHLSSVEVTAAAGIPWAADNDCFQGLDEHAYRRMLDRLEGLPGCLFVTVPDVVGDARTTLAQFDEWAPELEARGFPLGLVGQDGMTVADLEERAPRLASLFIGGSTEWKEGPEAAELAVAAKAAGLWVHWGRVNTRRRFDLIVATGACDSFDGSKWARFRKTYLDAGLEWLVEAEYNRAEVAGLRLETTAVPPATTTGVELVAALALELERRGIRPIAGGSQELDTSARAIRAGGARIRVLNAYDRGRANGYLDLGNTRRQGAIRRLEERLYSAKRERRLDLIRNPGDVDALELDYSRDDVVDAFRREALARIARRDGEPASVRNALRRAALELDEELVDVDDVEGPCSIELGLLGLALELERIAPRGRRDRAGVIA